MAGMDNENKGNIVQILLHYMTSPTKLLQHQDEHG